MLYTSKFYGRTVVFLRHRAFETGAFLRPCAALFGGQAGARRACVPAPFARALCARWGGPFGRAHQRGAQEYLPGPRQIWRTQRVRATRYAHAGRKKREKAKKHTRRPACQVRFLALFFGFSLDGALFPSYNAYHVSSWPCVPIRQKIAEKLCAFRRFLPRQTGLCKRCYEEAEHAEKIRSGRKLW